MYAGMGPTMEDMEAWQEAAKAAAAERTTMRWCATCLVGEHGTKDARCWYCGGPTTETKPR